jgi:prevent-host-death family protein
MTATEVARNFSSVLDAVANGETIIITRGGKRVAELSGTSAANGAAVADIFRRHTPDPRWADDIESVRELLYVEDRR